VLHLGRGGGHRGRFLLLLLCHHNPWVTSALRVSVPSGM
jgi:hypothetical protein